MAVRLFPYLFFCCLIFSISDISGQKTCGTVSYQEQLKELHPVLESKEAFEHWMSSQLKELQSIQNRASAPSAVNQVVSIPVVVHIIHNGESLGSGSNLDDSRIFEQIQRLNEDFRRLNPDTVNTPPEYLGVAADTEIEFVLAKRDPYGLATTGINRVMGERPAYDLVHNTELKALSYWPSEDYMNIWVVELESLLGYAQFPISSLGGLELASENRLTDGVVIDTDFFGNNAGLNPESIGRTATHEIGHFLGLRHTWGDGGCGVDDFCNDTPLSNSSNFGCPDGNSCGSDDMVENYMDLSDDLCMNLFTACQKNRMHVVLSNSPRRASLITSPGLQPPIMVNNDVGVREISTPLTNQCSNQMVPKALVQNTGINQITSFQVQLLIDDTPVESKLVSESLDLLNITTVTFGAITPADMMNVSVQITAANGGVDGNPENDQKNIIIDTQSFTSLPLVESFPSLPADWEIRNDDNSFTWEVASAPSDSPGNTAATINFFNYGNSKGEYDYLITPALDLSTFTGLSLVFDVAYAPFSANNQDGLLVAVSLDCGNTYLPMDYVYQKEGLGLATAPITSGSFVPSGRTEWRTESVNMDQYAGLNEVRIAFIGINDFGNNLYLDNITIDGTRKPDIDLAVTSIKEPTIVTCQGNISPSVVITNTGLNTVSSFQLSYLMDSGETAVTDYTGSPLAAGEDTLIVFDGVNPPVGSNNIKISIDQIDGQGVDGVPANNSLEQPFMVDNQQDLIPKIEKFQQDISATDWRSLSLDQDISWEVTGAQGVGDPGNLAAFLNFFSYPQQGQIDYLTSPVLDFTDAIAPTMTFDLAYAGSQNFNDGLLILLSTDCGLTYTDTLFQAFGMTLATVSRSSEFFPDDPSHWALHTVDLSNFAGEPSVRIAFAAINDFGNNLFIDNIQFFISNGTTSLELDENEMIIFPNPSLGDFNITFNLADRSQVNLRIIDPVGQTIWDRELPDVLNQTYGVQLPHASGIYILQATAPDFRSTRRIIMVR